MLQATTATMDIIIMAMLKPMSSKMDWEFESILLVREPTVFSGRSKKRRS
jgi:hypothetical protein